MRRGGRLALILTMITLLGLVGCTRSAGRPVGPKPSPTPAFPINVLPADNQTEVPVSAEIALTGAGPSGAGPSGAGSSASTSAAPGGAAPGAASAGPAPAGPSDVTLTAVTLADPAGAPVPGSLRADASSWVPDDPLRYSTTYTATVTAASGGKSGTKTTTFTTMARPGNRMNAHVYMSDNAVYGQAMPIVIEFKQGGVAPADRAAVERRLFVTSDPPQPGGWRWDSNTQIEYRPKEYWQPGTKLRARLALGGLPVGGGRYGQQDITINASIDTARRSIEVDNASKQLIASQDGQVVKTMPVSLGKPEKPSLSGTMVIMEKLEQTVFDSSTYGTPVSSADGYRTAVKFAERLTWDGQFIHAAPWSVAQQGRANVSHGCVNISTDNGAWVYNWSKVGDPVVVKGTEERLTPGNGWTAWDQPWEEFIKGSALHR